MSVEPVEIAEPLVLIRVPRAFRLGMSDLALYEATRGIWRIGTRREDVRFALAVYEGIVQEVYEIDHWRPALTATYGTRAFAQGAELGRSEFVGRRAPDEIRLRYLGKSVLHYFKRGAQNPITYARADK